MSETKSRPRLTRERWLELSLDVLESHGTPGLLLEEITRELGITTGSFYWHFPSHGEYLRALAEYWLETSTQQVIETVLALECQPRDRLEALTRTIIHRRARRLDIQFRSLAITYPDVRKIVERADKKRFRLVESLLSDLGFEGDALKVRTHCFVAVHSLEGGLEAGLTEREILSLLDERLKLFLGE